MSESLITCPSCGKKFQLTEALRAELQLDLQAQVARDNQELLAKKEQELIHKYSESEKLLKQKSASEAESLRQELAERTKQIDDARARETELLKKQRELDEAKKDLELTVQRTLAEERESIILRTRQQANEEHRLKLEEERKKTTDALQTAEDLKRRLEQGSQQLQGESLELDIEMQLRTNFPEDSIEPVAKGVRGGDVLQRISTSNGQASILWEIKNTKHWTDSWLEKLKDDQRDVKADIAIIVSRVLPKGIGSFGWRDGVWISDLSSSIGLATAIRIQLIEIGQARVASIGKNQKMELLYNYLSGQEFRQRIEAIADAFGSMRADLESEKRAMARLWSKREKQLVRALGGASGMVGDLQGIIGKSLPDLKVFELPEGESDIEYKDQQ